MSIDKVLYTAHAAAGGTQTSDPLTACSTSR
jgi:hypothetical protein